MDFKTLDDRVVVKKEETSTKTSSGIIITKPTETTNIGEVVLVGPGKQLPNGTILPIGISVGDSVMFLTNTGIDVKIDGVEYLVLRENEVLGIIED